MIRILVADDHAVIRRGIRSIVSREGEMSVIGEAANGRELLALAATTEHDLILLDLSMPDSDGLELIKQLKRDRPRIPILVLTMHEEEQYAIPALRAGANGYMVKDSSPAELVGAVRKVLSGGRYLTPFVAEALAGRLTEDVERLPHEKLSGREGQVLRLIAAGKRTREIAAELSVSVKTISTYRARIFEKTRMKNPAALAAYVVRHRLAD
jgi:two-component system, NarL family, invasion response regulator UvrY